MDWLGIIDVVVDCLIMSAIAIALMFLLMLFTHGGDDE